MKNATIQIRYDSDQTDALRMYLSEKGLVLEAEIEGFLDQLLGKVVPKQVVNYLLNRPAKPPRPPRSPKKPAVAE